MPLAPSSRTNALSRIIKCLPAQLVYYGSALGAIVLAGGGQLPPGLEFVAGGIGANLLSNLVDEIARSDDIKDEEIRQHAENAIVRSEIAKLLTKQDFLQGYARLIQRLDTQETLNQEILDELRGGFDRVATGEQVDELKQLLQQMLIVQQRTVHKPSAFISYARKDAEGFANRLHDDLEEQGIKVWLDKRDLPSGNSFIDEIDYAIKEADYFLLVVSPRATQSPYCRDEWRKALEHYKPIIPLLLIGTYDDLPREANVYLNDAPDFTDEQKYEATFEKLLTHLRQHPRQAGSLYGVPELPRNYLHREAEMTALRDKLTLHKTTVLTSISRRIGIQGMGGIGKSVVVAALTRDYAVRRSFQDGIFWLTFGVEPNLQGMWIRLRSWLGGGNRSFKDETEAADFFEQATRDRECLIVLDDIWESDHVKAFHRLGNRCRLLVTSRFANVLDEIDVHRHKLGLLSTEEARQLLAKVADMSTENLPSTADGILQSTGNLPLALAMIGAMVRGKPDSYWQDALDALQDTDLEEIAAKFPDYPYPNLFAAIEVSLHALDDGLREHYYDFAIFPDDVEIPEAVPLTFWKPMKGREVRKTLDELVDRSLLNRSINGSLTIHDLQLAFVRKQVNNLVERHKRLLSNYNPQQMSWHTVEDDGYLYDFLVYHLEAAQSHSQVTALFSDQNWMRVRFEQCSYMYRGFIGDLEIAWKIAQQQAETEIKDGKEPVAFVRCLRYALIRTSINSLSSRYVPALVARAVALELWATQRALSVADNISDAGKRADFYQQLLETGKLDQLETEIAQKRCIDSIFSSYDTEKRLVRLSPFLTQTQRQSTFQRAFAHLIGTKTEDNGKFKLSKYDIDDLIVLIPYIDDDSLNVCFSIVTKLSDQDLQSRVLKALAPFISRDNLGTAMEIAHSFADQRDQITTLAKLAQNLEQKDRLIVIELAEAASTIEDEIWRLYLLSDILPLLDAEDRRTRVTQMLHTIYELPEVDLGPMEEVIGSPIARALSRIVSYLTDSNIDWCISHISNIQHPYAKANVLETMLPHLNERQISSLKPEITKCTVTLTNNLHWFFSERLLATFLKYAEHLILSDKKILFNKVLEKIGSSLTMDVTRKSMVNAIAPYLQGVELQQYLDFFDDFGSLELRDQLLTHCCTKLTQTQILEYLHQSKDTNDSGAIVASLAQLLPSIEETRKQKVIQRCFDVACTLQDVADSFNYAEKEFEDPRNAVRELVPHMNDDLIQKTVQYLQDNDDFTLDQVARNNRFKLQITLLQYLNKLDRLEVVKLVLNDILYAPLLFHPAEFLIDIIPYLDTKGIEKLFAHAFRRLGEGIDAVDGEILAITFPYFSDEQVRDLGFIVLQYFSSLADDPKAARELEILTGERLLQIALDGVISTDGLNYNNRLLSSIAPHLDNALLDYALLRVRNNPNYYTNQMLAELVPHLDEDARNTVIQRIDDPYYRANAILNISLRESKNEVSLLLEKALTVAESISHPGHKAETMLRMIPHLSGRQKQQAIKAGIEAANKTTPKKVWECNALPALIPYVEYCEDKNELLQNIWTRLLHHLADISSENRSFLLLSFSKSDILSPPVFSPNTSAAIAKQLVEICWEWDWL